MKISILGLARIAIVIVTYNSAAVLAECLGALPEGSRGVDLTQVVVADNASQDESLHIAKEAGAQVVQTGRNAGYAAAINAGMATLDLDQVDGVMVLNPDCKMHPGALATLVGALQEPGRGIVVPRLTKPDGTLQPSLRREATVHGAFAEAVIGGTLSGRIGIFGEVITDPRHYERAGPFVWATGAAMLIGTDAIRQLGPWDESFLLYSEETEYALRAADQGWALWYEPAAVVEHIGGDSRTSPMLAALLMVNKVRLFRRRRGRIASAAYYLSIVLGQSVRAATGSRTARAALAALLFPSRRIRELPQ
ncbi:glycosyltransferase family 2 protein [Acrocarpospora macrocephala]|uniref:Glycosyl transferase family 2 n=1 Tax=Acrocarpospora macrocephala TaxID=150177 RepID=A0A5M3WIU1_9ACTN|nr:glycosyltransferase family 2 protein [Acrocarpospora macrocephala]GES08089.1 glycosyl transferase family 2 [Acrocarpospora macrocephala]